MRAKAGFTLLEVLVVVMIIAILATLVGLNVLKAPGETRIRQAQTQMTVFESALRLYHLHNSRYPTQRQGLVALCEKPTAPPLPASYQEGGYLEKRTLPRDPWGREYIYLVPGPDGEPFEIISYGADGDPGGEGENADISSVNIVSGQP